ncbi:MULTISPECIES: nuclease-related domain-containing protein [unclassified Bacillus (in: firmicutes)]|uniref:nuclease-related domain-containing protein n=1 Tax=unclassified Bacillus (in: firmicutes) TaxID=185979 RepID=UPI0008E0F098|nr:MULTISPECIES: nuclease-related domain-containing protein [unclassified Bacillus (in: firmicutes)]SFB11941.1 Nuclease-related domain-containing protein [Bacillus sp. UNCCL13]SFQ90381.1 Nuclease-related domain-containing protein [Bacillus sp. cl95]
MIVKERQKPIKLYKLEALLRRTSENHPKRALIKAEYAKSKAGFAGEKAFDHHLRNLPSKNYLILNDLRLAHEHTFFQMDTLVLAHKFFIIAEVKNLSGTLFFDTKYPQLIRTSNGVEKTFPDPLLQVKTQTRKLQSWLKSHSIPEVPIKSNVVISSNSSKVRTAEVPRNVFQTVTPAANFIYKVEEYEEIHKDMHLSEKELKKLAKLLIKCHVPINQDILELFDVPKNDIIKGVFCPECGAAPMKRHWGKWYCVKCRFINKNAHLDAIKDYSLLLGTTIHNQQFMNFLKISSTSSSSKLISSLNVPFSGTTRNRIYDITDFHLK